jgi:hypothetical protein
VAPCPGHRGPDLVAVPHRVHHLGRTQPVRDPEHRGAVPKNISLVNFDALFADSARPYLTWFMLASIFLRDVDSQTLGVGLWAMIQKGNMNQYFGQFCAGAVLASLPVVLLYLGFQKQLVGGLTQGSVK